TNACLAHRPWTMEICDGVSRLSDVVSGHAMSTARPRSIMERGFQAWLAVLRRVRRMWLRWRGVTIGRRCWIQAIEVPRNARDIVLGDEVSLDNHVVLLSTNETGAFPAIRIGSRTYVNRFTMFDASESIVVGERCMIGPHCYFTDHDHGMQMGRNIASQPLE